MDADRAAEALERCRGAALVAAAALIGPTVPGGIIDHHPDEAATATVRVAEMFLPWLADGSPLPVPERIRKREAAATAAGAKPATGEDDHGSSRPGPEED